uniref:Uncharacterized protein LOC111134851 n=1 Tax=Crassostrea virginica TaxID=6565 RepID=A0A8B8EIX7_CRAVI|nr:uncharacterized protein LOC111134851 [Crassostrea virginica]
MEYDLDVDGKEALVTIKDGELIIRQKQDYSVVTYELDDVIGCDEVSTGWVFKTEVTRLWVIEPGPSNTLLKLSKTISGDQRKRFQQEVAEKTKETRRPKRVLLMINPIGGNGTARKDFANTVDPVFKLAGISMDIIFSERSGQMVDVAKTYDFSKTDGVVLLGGDGSYHEVVNVLMKKRQEELGLDMNDPNATLSPLNIPIAMIPTGTGNGVAENSTGSKDVLTAALHVVKGKIASSHLLALYSSGRLLGFGGTASTYGFMTDLLYYSDRKFRWLGRSRYLFVPVWLLFCQSQTNRVFNAKVTYYTTVSERQNSEKNETEVYVGERKLSGYSSYTSETVVYNRTLWNLMTLNGDVIKDGQIVFDLPRMLVPKPSLTSTFIFFDTVTIGSVLRFFKHVAKRTPSDVQDSEMVAMNVRGLTVDLMDSIDGGDSEVAMLRRLIQLDGEMYQLESPSFQLWYKEDVVQVFSSYL